MNYVDFLCMCKQAVKDDTDIIAPAVAGGGTLLGSILYGRSRGQNEAAARAKSALNGHKVIDSSFYGYFGENPRDVITLSNGKVLRSARDKFKSKSPFAQYMGNSGRNMRINSAIDRAATKGAMLGGRKGLYAGIPLALIIAAMVNSWRSDAK